jgi:triacylglycerol lipase
MSVFVELPRNAYPDNALDGFTATPQFKLDNARAMMWLSQLAYETARESKVDDILEAWHLTKLGFASNDRLTGLPPHSACVVVAEGHGATFVAFAGSDPGKPEDWVTDFEAMPSPDNLHSGFERAVEMVWPAIQTAIANRTAPAQPLFFTGHSLGGALAILAASRAPLEPKVQQVVVYTFGSPRTGGDRFFDDYTPRLGDSTFRFIHGTDIVPTVPLTLPGVVYRHVGQAVQCRSGGLFDGVAPMARDGNKPISWKAPLKADLPISQHWQPFSSFMASDRDCATSLPDSCRAWCAITCRKITSARYRLPFLQAVLSISSGRDPQKDMRC